MNAIKTDYFNGFNINAEKKKKKARETGNSEEELALFDLSRTSGWRVLVDYINDMMVELDESVTIQMEQGADFEQIGRTSVVKEITKVYLKKILDKVKDAKEAVDKPEGGK